MDEAESKSICPGLHHLPRVMKYVCQAKQCREGVDQDTQQPAKDRLEGLLPHELSLLLVVQFVKVETAPEAIVNQPLHRICRKSSPYACNKGLCHVRPLSASGRRRHVVAVFPEVEAREQGGYTHSRDEDRVALRALRLVAPGHDLAPEALAPGERAEQPAGRPVEVLEARGHGLDHSVRGERAGHGEVLPQRHHLVHFD
mmetsp:Transcript_26179/g.75077  ORF Transcript_26179/g.75077 Transcript_26179/m.75077 type:complete len:200 (+) Transcript_26179:450-1049(+)